MAKQSIAEALVANYQNRVGIISNNQIDGNDFKEWCSISVAIYKIAQSLHQNKTWVSFSDLRQLPENQELYSLIAQIFGMIGLVNGYPLRRDSDLAGLFVSYIHTPVREEEKELIVSGNKRSFFRLRMEHYLARLIIEQQHKPLQILLDENEDFRNVRRLKSSRNKRHKRELLAQTQETTKESEIKEVGITFTNVVIRCSSIKCKKHHLVKSVNAVVDIMMPAGTIISEEINAGYCSECNVFFILEYDYRRLRSLGILLCQIISNENYQKDQIIAGGKLDLKSESMLHQSGYNVGATENLTAVQRQEILKRVIDNNLYSPFDLLNFLEWLIKRNKKVTGKDMSQALGKWEADRQFVIKYQKQKNK